MCLCLQGQLVAGFKYAAHGVDTKEVCSCHLYLSLPVMRSFVSLLLHLTLCAV